MMWLFKKIAALFRSEKPKNIIELSFLQPLEEDPPTTAPPANVKYILYISQPGTYDIDDGDRLVGYIYKQEGDEDHYTVWSLNVYDVSIDFRTLKEAKKWLGNPPMRKYR
jgi:hypothetical protein